MATAACACFRPTFKIRCMRRRSFSCQAVDMPSRLHVCGPSLGLRRRATSGSASTSRQTRLMKEKRLVYQHFSLPLFLCLSLTCVLYSAAVDVGDASLQYAFAVSDSQAASMQQCQASQPVAPVRLQYGSKSFTLVAKSFDSMGQSQMLSDAVGSKTTSPCIMSGASLSVGGAAVTGTGSFDGCKQDMLGPLGHTTCTASCSSLQCAVAGKLLPTLPADMDAVACSSFSR